MAFVVEVGGTMVGGGRYDRLPDEPTVAEVAFGVEDAHQGRGIGTQLLTHLTNYARHHGVEGFRAYVLPDNYAMMRVFRGWRMVCPLKPQVASVDTPISPSDFLRGDPWPRSTKTSSSSGCSQVRSRSDQVAS